jgi:hypothetical protein
VALTIIFGNLSLFEFVQVDRLGAEVEQLSDEVELLKESLKSRPIPGEFPDEGFISIQGIGYFQYLRVKTLKNGEPIDHAVTLRNVTFTFLDKGVIGEPVCRFFNVTFQDGSSEELQGCSYPTNFETPVKFTDHSNPKAGLIFYPRGGVIYLLVSIE